MGRLNQSLGYLSVPITVLLMQACSGLGYQGGSIPTIFTGINAATPISPTTIQLTWTAYPGAQKYNVYTPAINPPIANPALPQANIQPATPDPSIVYQYSVTAIDPTTGAEEGVRSDYQPVQLLPHFDFANSGSITAVSNTSVRVNWTSYSDKVNYKVFLAEKLADGSVNYGQFLSSTASVDSGATSALLPNLTEGHEYCAIVVAAYIDQTTDGPNATALDPTLQVSTALANELISPTTGGFAGSIIANSQKCVRTTSTFSTQGIRILTQKASLSNQPVFYVSVPGDVTEDNFGTVSTTIYLVNDTTGISTAVGTRVGTGRITSSALPVGRHHFTAVVSDKNSTAQAAVEIGVGLPGNPPTSISARPWVYVRSFPSAEPTPVNGVITPTGYYPEKQQGGYGSQLQGSSVAIGDFNCDGKKDLAIGIPNASTMGADHRPSQSGKVVIYYDMSAGTPANSVTSAGLPLTTTTTNGVTTFTNSLRQEITFDITSFAGDSGRDLQLGTTLYVGNFNNDNQSTNQFGYLTTTGGSANYKCDDLAIGSGYGPMFVLYGKRNTVIDPNIVNTTPDGGLNYNGPTIYTLNPSTSCDSGSNLCDVAVYAQTNPNFQVGIKMTSGDYNGDGYEDLAVTSSGVQGAQNPKPHGIWVFRGSEFGLIAPNSYNDTTYAVNPGLDNISTVPTEYKGFPFIPANPYGFNQNSVGTLNVPPSPTPAAGTATNGTQGGWGLYSAYFGSSISTLHNAYYDINSGGVNTGTKRIRDVLLIGNPNGVSSYLGDSTPITNLVHACIPKTNAGIAQNTVGIITQNPGNDINNGIYWDCSASFAAPVDPALGTAPPSNFGVSMVDVKNALRYAPSSFTDLKCITPANGYDPLGEGTIGFGNCFTLDPATATGGNASGAASVILGYPGAVAVGSFYGNSGGAYVYYGVAAPIGNTDLSRDALGIARNTYLYGLMGRSANGGLVSSTSPMHSLQNNATVPDAVVTGSTSPCNLVMSGATVAGEFCNIQKINHPITTQGNFGQVLGALPGNASGVAAKDTALAIAAPYRNIAQAGGLTYSGVGSIQMYLQNSPLAGNAIVVTGTGGSTSASDNCNVSSTASGGHTNSFCRISDGFSNSLTSSIDYDGALTSNVNFGLGGIVAGPLFAASGGDYATNSDIVIGVPGYNATPSSGVTVVNSGEGMAYFSHGGNYLNYPITQASGSSKSAWHDVNQSFSQESDLRFHQAISIGDINQDGVGDVAVRIRDGQNNAVRIYSGPSTITNTLTGTTWTSGTVGVVNSPSSYTTLHVQSDNSAGIRFVPIGPISTSGFPAFLSTGVSASYLMFDVVGGINNEFPTASGGAGSPRKLFAPSYWAPTSSRFPNLSPYLDFSDTNYFNAEGSTENLDNTLRTYVNFAHGDFNGDGIEDFAIGMGASYSVEGTNGQYSPATPGTAGRVMIFYGGAENGFQKQPDGNGGYPLQSDWVVDYSASAATHSVNAPTGPCSPSTGLNCKIQMLYENGVSNFGQSMTSVPVGTCLVGSATRPVSALVISGVQGGVPVLYTYRPRCLDSAGSSNNLSGLVGYNDTLVPIAPAPPETITLPVDSSVSAGITMTSVTGLMGANPPASQIAPADNLVSHLVITDQYKSRVIVYPIHAIDSNEVSFEVPYDNTVNSFTGAGAAGAAATQNAAWVNDGGRLIDYQLSSMMLSVGGVGSTSNTSSGYISGFGNGLSSIGDVNADGYADIGVGITSLMRDDTSVQVQSQGTVLVIFGGPNGPQGHNSSTLPYTAATEPSRSPNCYVSVVSTLATSVCSPALLYAPQPAPTSTYLRNGAYERSFLSPFSSVVTSSVENEGLGTFLFGVPGRDSLDALEANRILQGGAFYVLP